jgi:type IV pilus assembly protein PilM
MDDQSLWKKELSFGRKPKDQTDADESPATDEKPTSMWKKELSFKRKPKADAVEDDVAADAPAEEPIAEEPKVEEPVAAEPVAAEPEVAVETVWKKEVSFGRKAAHEDAVEEAEPVVAEATTDDVVLDEQTTSPDAWPVESVWKKEVSFSRTPETEPVVAEATADEVMPDEQTAHPEPASAETVWKKEVSFSRTPEAEPVAERSPYEELVAEEEPVADVEPVADEELPAEAEPVAAESVEVEASAEPWDAAPAMPPAPIAEALVASVPAPTPSEVVHPPVAAADLPLIVDEDAPKVPFWKKELSLGGKKGDKPVKERKQKAPAPTSSELVQPPVAAADLLPIVGEDAPKVPFWKKELSLGGKKGDKPVKERKQKPPKVKAERAPKTKEPKEPKQPKEPKEPKERKQKTPKVKAERGNAKGRLTGLKIGASQLAAARVSNNGSAELLQVAREPLAPGIIVGGELRDPDALAEALKDFFTKHGLPKKGVRLGIANNRIGVRTFEIAGIEDQKQLANAIRFRAQETLPIPIDEAVLDYQVLGEGVDEDGQPTKRVLLVVAYRELIDRYVDACKKAGITLVGIDLEAFALLRALQAPQEGVGTDATAALVVVAIGHERSTFAVSDGRVCEFTRVLEWGGSALNVAIARAVDAAPSEVEGTKRALSLMDEMVPDGITADQAKTAREGMRRAIQTFARELVSSLQYYQNQPGSLGIGEIVLTGGTAHLPGLAGELERLIGVHVRVGDPLARMKVSKKVGQPEQIGSLAVAIGLGIED